MRLFIRKLHYWLAILAAFPIFIVIISGLILQVKDEVAWVKPPEQRGLTNKPSLSYSQIFDIARMVPQASIQDWKDIWRIYLKPGKGIAKVQAKNNWEVQIDFATGDILQVAYRRTDFIEDIHQGSFLVKWPRLWIFLPAGIIFLILWISGIYMFFNGQIFRKGY